MLDTCGGSSKLASSLTESVCLVTPAFILGVNASSWTMLERIVSVADVLKEMNLVLPCKQSSTYAVHRCVTPSLINMGQYHKDFAKN